MYSFCKEKFPVDYFWLLRVNSTEVWAVKNAIKLSDHKNPSNNISTKVNENYLTLHFIQIVDAKACFTEEANASRKVVCFDCSREMTIYYNKQKNTFI